ncbi:hypothetical protein V1264_007712 [Littorina saxatilis]|uniref:Uncharacterized protein n=1 Tax=Littorina saxatilis TaxID=31220 RepID=A0AAN9G432_9CAEN
MVRSTTVVFLLVLASVLCSTHANWYGKRGDRADFYSLLTQQRLDTIGARDMNAEVALAAIDQILQLYRQHKAEANQLKERA